MQGVDVWVRGQNDVQAIAVLLIQVGGLPGVFYEYFYNHARRVCFEKLSHIEVSRSPSGHFKPLLDPGGSFTSETATRRSQK